MPRSGVRLYRSFAFPLCSFMFSLHFLHSAWSMSVKGWPRPRGGLGQGALGAGAYSIFRLAGSPSPGRRSIVGLGLPSPGAKPGAKTYIFQVPVQCSLAGGFACSESFKCQARIRWRGSCQLRFLQVPGQHAVGRHGQRPAWQLEHRTGRTRLRVVDLRSCGKG